MVTRAGSVIVNPGVSVFIFCVASFVEFLVCFFHIKFVVGQLVTDDVGLFKHPLAEAVRCVDDFAVTL